MAALCRLLILLMPATVVEVQNPGRALCRLERNASEVKLSGELRLTISIEGPAPVEVEIPQPLTTSKDWTVRPLPPKISSLPGDRERWQQEFVLAPYQVGNVPLKLEPMHYRTGNEVLDWPLTWKPLDIKVVSMIDDPERTAMRPVTDIEIVPRPERGSSWWYAVLLFVPIGVAAALIGWVMLRRSPAPPEIPAAERALNELRKLQENDGPKPEQLPQLADVLRRFLEWRFQLAATRQTTSEFLVSLSNVEGFEATIVKKIESILHQCDLVKFAGVALSRDSCQSLRQSAHDTIAQLGQPGPTPSAA